jgi:hypothetical protein
MLPSWIVWGLWGLAFVLLEIPAVFGLTPWKTLSSTVWDLIQRTNGIAAIAVVGGLAVLAVHLVAPSVFERKKKNDA